MSISSSEHLSNEIVFEIFDYLDGIDIYEAFSNLNCRLEQFLNLSSLLFKIKLQYSTANQIFMKNYQKILLHNKSQIFFMNVWLSALNDQFFTFYPINLSFNHLESLIVEYLESDIFISFLTNLAYLPYLSSLSMKTWNIYANLNDIYRVIFALPTLRYGKFSLCRDDSPISLPMTTNQQLSTIEHLVISHSCKFNELFTILSYTSQHCRLSFMDAYDDDTNIGIMSPITIYSKLKVLHITIRSDNIDYLDSIRWKKLILEYLPQLEKFYFDYYIEFEDDTKPSKYIGQFNQFSSSFWID
ncbi:unnamed protein product [Rotaria sp. Silwood1]|nr:unnamed protein product [Rotaria sp. Silwood1]